MNADPGRDLEEAGRRAAPPPDSDFADRLEARLLAIAQTVTPAPAPRGLRRTTALRVRLALTGAALAVAAIGVLLVMGMPDTSEQLALARPINVEVTLSDGTTLENPAGVSLPDGAVVTVGDGGFAVIDGTELHAGDVATIQQGRVHVEHSRPDGVASATSSTTPRPTPKGSQGPDRTPKATADRSPDPTPKPTPAPDRTPEPFATPPAPPPPPAPTPSPPPTAKPTPSPSAPVVHLTPKPRLRAHANAGGNRVLVRWTATKRAASYLLIVTRSRVGAAADPEYPGSKVFRTFAKAPQRWLRFGVPDPVVEVRVMVVALGKHGHEVSRSRIAIIRTGGERAGGEQTGGELTPPAADPPGEAPPGDLPPATP